MSGDTFRLTIADVTVDDGGEYICEGSLSSAVFTLEVDCKCKLCILKVPITPKIVFHLVKFLY